MSNHHGDEPEIVTHRIPRIEVYRVTEHELDSIEQGAINVAQDLTFAVASFSCGVSFLIALLVGALSQAVFTVFWIIVILSGVVFLYTGIRWLRARKTAPTVIGRIRSRRVEPDVTSGSSQQVR